MKRPRKYQPIRSAAIKIDLPNVFQLEDYTCGASALLSIAAYYGVGPEEEWEVAEDVDMKVSGTDPKDIRAGARKYGLQMREYRPMTDDQLRWNLDHEEPRPVMLMLQAWGNGRYRKSWSDGHWVIAIGYTQRHVFFEDPSIYKSRGYLSWSELDTRWHDVEGPKNHHVTRYGLAIWKPGIKTSAFVRTARHID